MAPDSLKLEVEFTAGSWTDISAFVDWSAGGSTQYGRSTPYSTPQPAQFNCTLDNTDGRFTPNRQTLVDGVTAHPYWPNVVPRKRIRFSGVVSGTPYQRFLGYVRGWPPGMKDRRKPRVSISAIDRSDQLSHVKMAADIQGEVLADNPVAYWPMNEPAGSTSSANASGVTTDVLVVAGTGAALTFGSDGPGVEQGLAVAFAQGKYMGTQRIFNRPYSAFTLECWCEFTTVNQAVEAIAELVDTNDNRHVIATGTAGPASGIQLIEVNPSGSFGTPATAALNDGAWHQVVVGADNTLTPFVYIDGASITSGLPVNAFGSIRGVRISQDLLYSSFLGSVAHVAVYDYALSAARILAHYEIAQQSGELTSDKVKRFLTYGGLVAGDMNLDTGIAITGTYAQGGQDIVTACNDMATTEGGGSVFYITPDGKTRFTNRYDRNPAAPALTIDMGSDADGNTYQPAFDDTGIVSQVQAARATASGTASTQVAKNTAIESAYPDILPVTSYAADDDDVQHLAEQVLSENDTPEFRLQQVTVDFTNASTAGLFAAAASTLIGDRIRVTSIYAAAADASQKDVIVEGWADTFDSTSYKTTFDTSPADQPARMLANSTTYGRAQAIPGGLTLNAALTAGALSGMKLATASGPTVTTKAGSYSTPIDITIDSEIIGINAAPTGGTSPQTCNSLTRGKYGTTAAAHANGAQVALYPVATAAL